VPNNPPAKVDLYVDGDKRKGLIADQPPRSPREENAHVASPLRGILNMFKRGADAR